jgi:hypothetical protein
MKNAPSIYKYENIKNSMHYSQVEINGEWVPARPVGYYSIWRRFKAVWLAFTGQCDLVRWPGGQ